MLNFLQVGYEILQLFDQTKALVPIKTEGRINSKVTMPSASSALNHNSSRIQVTDIPSKVLHEKPAPKSLHFKFHSTSSAVYAPIQHTPLALALKDLWNIYTSLYQLTNTEKENINQEFETIIHLIQKLAIKLPLLGSEKKIARIINKVKIIHGKIQIAVYEAYQKNLIVKIFNLLEIELNEDITQYAAVLKTLVNESFYLKMQKTISFLLRKLVKKHSVQKTFSTIEKSFLEKLNINEISKEFICGVQDINTIMDLAEEHDGTYLKYFRQQKQFVYGLIGGGCAGSAIQWGIELLSNSANERRESSRLLLDSTEMLASFMHEEVPNSIKSLNFLSGESIFNKQVNLYQLFYDLILSNDDTLQEFSLSNDGPISKNIFKMFSENEKESILAVFFQNPSASASNNQTGHLIALATINTGDNVVYYLSDADSGDFSFNNKSKFIKFLEKYCDIMRYEQYNSYTVTEIKPALKKVMDGEVELSSNIKDVIENYAMSIREINKRKDLQEQKDPPGQSSEEKAPWRKISNH